MFVDHKKHNAHWCPLDELGFLGYFFAVDLVKEIRDSGFCIPSDTL